jgi:hypothetical protein
MAVVAMILLFVASAFVVPITYRTQGEPLSLMCVGIVAASALRRRTRKLSDEKIETPE